MKTVHYEGPAYLLHNPASGRDPLKCEGALRSGGRFNPDGSPALYLSLKPSTTQLEQSLGRKAQSPTKLQLYSYHVDIDGILDLRRGYQKQFSPPWRLVLLQDETPPGWMLYKASMNIPGIRGFLVPSYTVKGQTNLVLIRWETGQVILDDPESEIIE